MRRLSEATFSTASALSIGMRDHQEDAVICDFPVGSELGLAVLADGMGGHAAGDVASKIVMTEVYSELKFQSAAPEAMFQNVSEVLHEAAVNANDCLRAHVLENPEAAGMGATLVAAVLFRSRMHWISIGDSPLYLFRDGQLQQLNEDHSMAPQIDFMVDSGLMDSEIGRDHPDRNCLTSVLAGEEIVRIDCPDSSFDLQDEDIVLVCSDGIQTLRDEEIEGVLRDISGDSPSEIADTFLGALEEIADPHQDNVSLSLIKVSLDETASGRVPTRPLGHRSSISDMPQRLHLSEVSVRPRRMTRRVAGASPVYKPAES